MCHEYAGRAELNISVIIVQFKFNVHVNNLELTSTHHTHNHLVRGKGSSIDRESTNGARDKSLPEAIHSLCPPDILETVGNTLISSLLGVKVVALDARFDNIDWVGNDPHRLTTESTR
jgi:hypothetical protein